MLHNVQRLRAQYQRLVQERAQSEKDRAEQGGKTQSRETPDDRMDDDDIGDAGEKSKKNVRLSTVHTSPEPARSCLQASKDTYPIIRG